MGADTPHNIPNINEHLLETKINCLVNKHLNYNSASYFEKRSKNLNLAIILLSTCAGGINISTSAYSGIIASALSFLVGFATTLKAFLKWEDRSNIHYQKYQEFNRLIADVDYALCAATADITAEEFRRIKATYYKSVETTPMFEDKIISNFKQENADYIEKGSQNNIIPDNLLNLNSFIKSYHYQYFTEEKELNSLSLQTDLAEEKKKLLDRKQQAEQYGSV